MHSALTTLVPLILLMLIWSASWSVGAAPITLSDTQRVIPPTEKVCLRHVFESNKEYKVKAYLYYGPSTPAGAQGKQRDATSDKYWEDIAAEDFWGEELSAAGVPERIGTITAGKQFTIGGVGIGYFCIKLNNRATHPWRDNEPIYIGIVIT